MVVARDMFLKGLVFCAIAVVVLGFAYKGAKRFDISWEFLVIGAVFVALLDLSLVLLMRMRGKGISRGVSFLRFLVFCGVVGAVVGLAYNGAKHMGVHWFLISNNGVFVGTIGLVPFFALEGVRCVRVLLGWCLKK
ncbi:hypothetical protein [Bartonella sp. CM31XJBT]|uniref:hypothetical protein n=1 Tax=Bartonella sp. CM31XJBT TaxID=3019090 RepID=UPI00235F3ED3|nr:hypothetical protein [Bartonella sp. CM31XJBT]